MPQYAGTGQRVTRDVALAEYLDTACWASYDDSGKEFYADELHPSAVQELQADWEDFLQANSDDIGPHTTRAASCFWLNRNGHGTGFWDDHTWDEETRERLNQAAKVYGSAHLYRGDDGQIYYIAG